MQPWHCLRRFALAWWERTVEGSHRPPREEAGQREPGGRGEQDPERSSPPMLSADDAEYPREYRTLGGGGSGGSGGRRFSNVGLVHTSERRHTVIAAQSLEALSGLQKADAERKRDAFMDHLKSKYPQHALALRGQQDRLREQVGGWTVDHVCLLSSLCSHLHGDSAPTVAGQPAQQPNYWSFKTRSSRHSQGAQPGLADQAAKLSFASAESLETMSEAELPLGFSRMNRFRQSLPLSRSTSQTKLRSPGVLFLQFGEETRRVHITHEVSSLDTLHALIAHMFPQKLTMGMLKSPNTAILIKDEARNIFYELEDVRDIQDRSIIKIYRKEPLYSAFPGSHLTNGDLRREMVYASRESSPTRRLNNLSPAPHLSSGSPPPGLPSASPSRSRLSYAGGSGGRPPSYAGSPVHHSERLGGVPPAPGVSPSPSAILERRDVKPDEDLAGKGGGMMLVKGEGLYADPYGLLHEGRLSLASTGGDPFAYPGGGLYKRGSVRSLSTYSATALQSDLEDSLYKAATGSGGPLYGDGFGFRLPPASPQKLVDVATAQGGPPPPHSPYSGPPSRSSPVRQSFRKDSGSSSSVFAESPGGKPRGGGGPSSSGVPPSELFPGPGERPLAGFGPPVPAKDTETRERMEAMEKQIASLTGLVQSALLRGSEAETPSEKIEGSNGAATPSAPCGLGGRNTSAPPVPAPPPPSASSTPAGPPTAVTRLHMQLHLHDLQHNASDLRNQLQQLRKMQMQNQESVRTLLKRTEAELSLRVSEAVRKQEDPLQRQRTLVEEERLRYLSEEELVTQQLNDLEKSVEKIQKEVSHNHRLVPGPELEEKALVLKQLGETLTELKSQFPGLQSKMRVVLRVEVEAVKFLKEEPQRLDGLLKRCRGVTDTLAQIRRQVDEGTWPPPNNLLSQSPKKVTAECDFGKSLDFEVPPPSPPLSLHELGVPGEGTAHTPKGSNPSRGPETPTKRSVDKAVSVEAAERDWEEKRAALSQYSAKDINRLLEETQAELLKAIPDLDCAGKPRGPAPTPEHKPSKAPHDELTVPRYRTEKPSKSPPPPPPRRSFPSSHGLTTTRTGEVVVTSKKDSAFIKKAESEELEVQKPQVKLRRTVSEVARPASTPPIMASAIKDEDDEDRIIAELEVFERSSMPLSPTPRCQLLPASLSPQESGSLGVSTLGPPRKTSPLLRSFCIPQIILTECASNSSSPPEFMPKESGKRIMPIPLPRTFVSAGKSMVINQCQALPLDQNLTAAELVGTRSLADTDVCPLGSTKKPRQEEESLKMVGTKIQALTEVTIQQLVEEKGAGLVFHRGEWPDGDQGPGAFVGTSTTTVSPEESSPHSEQNTHISVGVCEGRTAPQAQREKSPFGLDSTERDTNSWLPFQRLDSLEETLLELEATLNVLGKAPSAPPIGTLSVPALQFPGGCFILLYPLLPPHISPFCPSELLELGRMVETCAPSPPAPGPLFLLLAL
ncbi:SRC kinase signaling inhibitor 1 isoform X4 [Macrotis lagotis]|uniref:SRC kinase signaling inhibitor 1 isoform X4 n=1 Tax=Macrotis lagotis TaxID=92651 RepID=UPI003D6869B7